MKSMYDRFGITEDLKTACNMAEEKIRDEFKNIEDIALNNQAKVLEAMQEFGLSDMHFGTTSGYGYDDVGREIIEKIYAKIFNTEDALVRIQFVNGTHTLSTALFGILRPNDTVLSINGAPYDTLKEVIGIAGTSKSSLKEFGINYAQIDLLENNYNIPAILDYIKNNKVKMVIMQRSKGYEYRKSLYIDDIKEAIEAIRSVDKEVVIMADNCYGEFVEELEPTDVGADLAVGSLIKNIGGGLADMGGYIVGKKEYIELCAERLTCAGIGKECGATLGQNKKILQGLFMAPAVVKNSLKVAILASAILDEMGYDVMPKYNEKRSDIVQAIKFGDKDILIKYIQGIQMGSPVDSNALPIPWAMPGYEDEVIMAAGTFVQGASIELSADSPIRAPYVAYMQGSLTYESGKIAILKAIQNMSK